MTELPESVVLCEVGPRDGFQLEPDPIPTDTKIAIVDALSGTGLTEIQATSFVHPRAVPQLADAEQVMAGIQRHPDVLYSALVPNERGAQRAIAAGVGRVDMVVSVSATHCRNNTNMTPDEAMARAGRVAVAAHDAGLTASLGLATALGCPFEGFPAYQRVEAMVAEAVEIHGFDEIAIADTAGLADPGLVEETMTRLRGRFGRVPFTLHLHDTRRMGLANVVAGLRAGVRRFDVSISGLGGCPFSPGATGNVATEDVGNLLDLLAVATAARLSDVVSVAQMVRDALGHADSGVLRAGTSRNPLLAAVPPTARSLP